MLHSHEDVGERVGGYAFRETRAEALKSSFTVHNCDRFLKVRDRVNTARVP